MAKFVLGPKSIPPFASLRAFQAVGALGGIRKAATVLQTDHTVISRHIKSLEAWLGVQLLTRVGRGLELTEQGALYHSRISTSFIDMADATTQLTRNSGYNCLRIRALPGFGYQWLSAKLGSFRLAAPQIQVDLRMTDEPADFFIDGADIDIRFSLDPDFRAPNGIRSVAIGRPHNFPVASPAFLATLPTITEPRDLIGQPLLLEEDDRDWQAWFRLHGIELERELPGPRLWHIHVALEAARHGQGIALANNMLLRDDLETGRLVPVGPSEKGGFPAISGAYYLLARSDRWDDRNIARFRRWILNMANELLSEEERG